MAKRILIYTNHFFPEQFKINEIVDWLSNEDFEVRVITGLPNYPSGKLFKGYGIRSISQAICNNKVIINRLPLITRGNGNSFMLILNYLSYFFSASIFTIYLIFQKKYDYVFVHHTSPIFIAIHPIIYCFFRPKTKKYLWDLDIWPETLEAMQVIRSKTVLKIIAKLMSYLYSYYDKILISSNGLREILQTRFRKEIIYFPNWAEKEIELNSSNNLNKLNLPKDKFIIMYTGNIGVAQNFGSLITTIKLLKGENILWVFIGGGRYKKTFISEINNHKLNKYCLFKDPVSISNIPNYVFFADAMFLSLKSNKIFEKTIPAKLQSYLALQKPVIGVIQGEGASVIKSSKCGIVQENSDYIELSNQIKEFIKLPKETLQEKSKNAKNFYDNNFSSDKRRRQFLSLFK